MTEKEIMEMQEQRGNKEFFLMLVGKFFLAYGHGAFALSRGTGYRVMKKPRKVGFVITCGFPVDCLDTVLQRVRSAGGTIESVEPNLYHFTGLDGTPDERMICEQQPKQSKAAAPVAAVSPAAPAPVVTDLAPTVAVGWLEEAVLSFNLSMSTPLDAMIFIGKLQKKLNSILTCESPVGQGLRE